MELLVLSADEAVAHVPDLAELLVDAVDGGASVHFVRPFGLADALEFWRGELTGDRVVVLAVSADGVDGCVQLVLAPQPNQAFRADVSKMLVHRRARRRGLGAALLAAVEEQALSRGRTLLTLDTQAGSAGERLYVRGGWTKIGEVPAFATSADGTEREGASFFYKQLV